MSELINELMVTELRLLLDEMLVVAPWTMHHAESQICDQDDTVLCGETPVVLGDDIYVECTIPRAEMNGLFKDLSTIYLTPLARAFARHVDKIITVDAYSLLTGKSASMLPGFTRNNAESLLEQARIILDESGALIEDRAFLWTPHSEVEILQGGVRLMDEVVYGFSPHMTYEQKNFAWQKEAILVATRLAAPRGTDSNFITMSSGLGVQVTIRDRDDACKVRLGVLIGVTVPNPQYAVLFQDLDE